jgi:lipopolysaccharide assembly protein A
MEYWNNLTKREKVFLILKVLLGLWFLIFIIKNWQETEVNFLFFKVQLPLTILIFLSSVVGALISSIWFYRKLQRKNQETQKLTDLLIQNKDKTNESK